jgi:C-terminal processing protease CtpA/Prc
MLDDGVGYLRIADMDDEPAFVARVLADLHGFRDTRGLVIDVRGNGGGSRVLLRELLPRFLAPGRARVANVAAYRLGPGEPADAPEGYLENRFLWPLASSRWSPASRAAITSVADSFRPEWAPGPGAFSAWHWFVVEPAEEWRYERPVAILQDEACYSATDVFLAAFQGLPNVTLVGTPSGGGSGRARRTTLAHSRLEVQASTMASFRSDGRLYDGRSVEPDLPVEPTPAWWVGEEDPVLAAAVRRLAPRR